MREKSNIFSVRSYFRNQRIALPELAGIYAFWWIGDKDQLLAANRHIVLKGPGGRDIDVEYRDWWPPNIPFPCLYVGKTTNIKNRFSLHIKRRCLGRLHQAPIGNAKVKPHSTSCQLRFGIEHIFPTARNPLEIIYDQVGFSFRVDFDDNDVAERFFEEDRLIGEWRPWFNIDSER